VLTTRQAHQSLHRHRRSAGSHFKSYHTPSTLSRCGHGFFLLRRLSSPQKSQCRLLPSNRKFPGCLWCSVENRGMTFGASSTPATHQPAHTPIHHNPTHFPHLSHRLFSRLRLLIISGSFFRRRMSNTFVLCFPRPNFSAHRSQLYHHSSAIIDAMFLLAFRQHSSSNVSLQKFIWR
jgi:hypothetical protein